MDATTGPVKGQRSRSEEIFHGCPSMISHLEVLITDRALLEQTPFKKAGTNLPRNLCRMGLEVEALPRRHGFKSGPKRKGNKLLYFSNDKGPHDSSDSVTPQVFIDYLLSCGCTMLRRMLC